MKNKNVIHSVRPRIVDLGAEPLFALELKIEELESYLIVQLLARSTPTGGRGRFCCPPVRDFANQLVGVDFSTPQLPVMAANY